MGASIHQLALVIVTVACAAGCASAARQQRPGTGTLTVGVTASGASASTLTVKIVVEPAGVEGSLKADARVFTSDDVPFGAHTVRLTALPSTCRAENGTEREITINERRRSAVVRFDLRCE